MLPPDSQPAPARRRPPRRWSEYGLTLLTVVAVTIAVRLAYAPLGRAAPPGEPGAPPDWTAAERAAGWDRRVSHLHVSRAPVVEVVAEISRQTGIRVKADWAKLVDDTHVSADLENVTASRALPAVLGGVFQSSRLEIADGVIAVVGNSYPPSQIVYADHQTGLVVRDYDLREALAPFPAEAIPPPPPPPPTASGGSLFGGGFGGGTLFGAPAPTAPGVPDSIRRRALIELIPMIEQVVRGDLPDFGGPGLPDGRCVNFLAGRLVVVATEDEQVQVGRFLRRLRPVGPAGAARASGADDAGAVPDRLLPVVEIPSMPLERALVEFSRQARVNLVAPGRGRLEAARAVPVEAHLKHVTVWQALRAILAQVDPELRWSCYGDVITIDQPGEQVMRVYDVGDLLPPTALAPASPAGADDRAAAQDLADLIERAVLPEERGGPYAGRVRPWGGVTLIVTESADVQRDVARFLWTLRRVQPRWRN